MQHKLTTSSGAIQKALNPTGPPRTQSYNIISKVNQANSKRVAKQSAKQKRTKKLKIGI